MPIPLQRMWRHRWPWPLPFRHKDRATLQLAILAARLGRHAVLLQALALDDLPAIAEPVVFDHFETFVFSQEDRLGIAVIDPVQAATGLALAGLLSD